MMCVHRSVCQQLTPCYLVADMYFDGRHRAGVTRSRLLSLLLQVRLDMLQVRHNVLQVRHHELQVRLLTIVYIGKLKSLSKATLTLAHILSPQWHAMLHGNACHLCGMQRRVNVAWRRVCALFAHCTRIFTHSSRNARTEWPLIDTQWYDLFMHTSRCLCAFPRIAPTTSRMREFVVALVPLCSTLYTLWVKKKLGHFYFYCNFGKCWSIFKILSMSESERNGS